MYPHKGQIVKYPSLDEVSSSQGVGPHYDSGFLTFVSFFRSTSHGAHPCDVNQLYQASNHPGLQVQNLAGEWIDVPPVPHTFVVNIGKGNYPHMSLSRTIAVVCSSLTVFCSSRISHTGSRPSDFPSRPCATEGLDSALLHSFLPEYWSRSTYRRSSG